MNYCIFQSTFDLITQISDFRQLSLFTHSSFSSLFFQIYQPNIGLKICIITICILVGIIIFLFFSRKKLWNRFNRIEQQLILSQINPHFIFNSLTAIQSYIFRNDPLQAGKYLSSFSKLVRLVLESSKLEMTTIEREIRILRLYFELQTLRFEGRFDFNIEVDESIDIDELSIPPMLTQPFIENSIEHGFIQLSKKGIIIVRFIKREKSIIIEIEDNGIGIEESKLVHLRSGRSHQSLATEITNSRINKIWQLKRLKIKMNIIDLTSIDETKFGSLVRFKIPVIN
jgi:LytS/YehU family sensor histidine kinase